VIRIIFRVKGKLELKSQLKRGKKNTTKSRRNTSKFQTTSSDIKFSWKNWL